MNDGEKVKYPTDGRRQNEKNGENPARPFRSNLEYLAAHLDYLKLLAALRAKSNRTASDRRSGEPKDFRLSEMIPTRRMVERRKRRLNASIQATLAAGSPHLPLEDIVRTHRLDEIEKFILLAVLGPDLDDAFERAMGAMVTRCRSSKEVRTVLALLCDGIEAKIKFRRYFIHSGRLIAGGLLNMAYSRDLTSESEFMSMELQAPRRVASLILGEFDVDDQLLSFSAVIDPQVNLDQVVLPPGKRDEVAQLIAARDEYLQCRKDWGFDDVLSYGRGTVILFSGPPGTGKTMLSHALARAAGYRLMLVDFQKVLNSDRRNGLDENLQRIFHEARLRHAIVFFDEADEMFTDRACNGAMPTLLRELERLEGVCILATNRRQVLDAALDRRILYKLDFEIPTPEQREEIWRKHLPERAPLGADLDLKALAEEFEFSGGYIKNAVLTAISAAARRAGGERRITQADLRHAAALQRSNRLTAHADKIQPRVALADVVADADTRRQIGELLAAARQRTKVFATWGFGKKANYGRGLAALLSGPSGTGKSMTAEAIAHELGQNLYPVRMQTLISKYVGETSKNLAAVFAAAREAEAIVFFDEADALFASRLDEPDHHAHYINQQVNVLLKELEKFDGIVLLASNRPEAFDPAFERRIRYHIPFKLPDCAARAELWRKLIPPEAPLAEGVDFAELAERFEFSGGTIRGAVLRAAFAAASDGQRITRDLLFQAAEAETPLKKTKAAIGFQVRAASREKAEVA
jgi:SpoVK/Ycf46/Vps4 family AAA+-type ATPase